MNRCAWPAIAIITAACGQGSGPPTGAAESRGSAAGGARAAPAARPDAPSRGCKQLPFAESTPVPEASGAAWLTIDGKLELVVVGDSGNDGAYGIVDPETGATVETGKLPLSSEAGDDIEGVAVRGDKLYGLTSAGWMRVWRRHGAGFELVEPPYPIGPVTLSRNKLKNHAAPGDGMVCDAHTVNCGRNYEGLCLAAAPRSPACVGFAASKADGHLYCLTDEAGKLVAHHDRAIEITRPGALADCAFSDDDTLWAGSNMFDLGNVYRITHWDAPGGAAGAAPGVAPGGASVDKIGSLAIGFPETLAVRGELIYRMSDTGGSPSLMAKFRCPK